MPCDTAGKEGTHRIPAFCGVEARQQRIQPPPIVVPLENVAEGGGRGGLRVVEEGVEEAEGGLARPLSRGVDQADDASHQRRRCRRAADALWSTPHDALEVDPDRGHVGDGSTVTVPLAVIQPRGRQLHPRVEVARHRCVLPRRIRTPRKVGPRREAATRERDARELLLILGQLRGPNSRD